MEAKNMDRHFVGLVMMLASAAWQQMGKIANPMTGKVDRNMPQVQMMIETLSMLQNKTKGNLSTDEQKSLENVISDLQLNYADEVKKTDKPADSAPSAETGKVEEKKEDSKDEKEEKNKPIN
ncbi:DUF1844 domain-containing protein [Elusimicrobiota bacterium]